MHIPHNRLLGAVLANLDFQDTGIKGFVLCRVQQFLLLHGQGHGISMTPVNYRGNFPFATQAAARTFPHIFTDFRGDRCIVRHDNLVFTRHGKVPNKADCQTRDQARRHKSSRINPITK